MIRMPRLSVNIADDTATAIRELMEPRASRVSRLRRLVTPRLWRRSARQPRSAPEVIHNATGLYKFLEDAQKRGDRIQLVEDRPFSDTIRTTDIELLH
jgi:hypothetical protein